MGKTLRKEHSKSADAKLHSREFLERKRQELERAEWKYQQNLKQYLKDKGETD